ncbi:MAG: FGGY family carbohydrate kinase [Bacteroidetes bacterium]|nr:FGGY family carbohydrate kinase [Bacteroidota bacterium]MDA1120104.1 FGGY family carbohydrate kinase [Bacteroidota bacterium]
MFLLGYDIGSSSIKAALVRVDNGEAVGVVQYPSKEMEIISNQVGWAEQQPEIWWENVGLATSDLLMQCGDVDPSDIKSIGISYQMHGLVLIDKDQKVLRPSIIWCDSRAVEIGDRAFANLGNSKCFEHLLNSPGNFTASKLKWVIDNEPGIIDKADKFMLPGDYIAMKLTGEVSTTIQGLSEGMLWDFKENRPAQILMEHYGIPDTLVPDYSPCLETSGELTRQAAAYLGLKAGIPVTYRAGDQPNNAMSLGVLEPGEIAATGGTSGVVYGVVEGRVFDEKSRVNGFAHVNHTKEISRIGVLLCINGAGIQFSWVKNQLVAEGVSYEDMEEMIRRIPIGSDELRIIPFGNGAERMFGNRNPGAHVINLQFNRHRKEHYYRAALEGIAFSFVYGMELMQQMGIDIKMMKVGNDNLFQSAVFSNTISALMGTEIQVIDTTGAVGAAKASGLSAGVYSSLKEAYNDQEVLFRYEETSNTARYLEAYENWKTDLGKILQ